MLKLGISWKRRGDIERWALFDVNCIVREIQIRHDDRRHGKPQATCRRTGRDERLCEVLGNDNGRYPIDTQSANYLTWTNARDRVWLERRSIRGSM